MSPLEAIIIDRIRRAGPLPVADYMALVMGHPEHGYYRTRDPLGRGGDFTTAPEISQMFGELIGAWAADTWDRIGRPAPVALVELGPGRGTLMADALRAIAQVAPDFRRAAELHLVETSPVLRRRQAERLGDSRPVWHDALATVPHRPLLLIANEFIDALPVRQRVRTDHGWAERVVDWRDGRLSFATGPVVASPSPAEATPGAIVEDCPAGTAIAAEIGGRIAAAGGAALIIDYGYTAGSGDTLQAVRRHDYAVVLEDPGEVDLSAHVDFTALAAAASAAGAAPQGPVAQGRFLSALGIGLRAARLRREATPEQQVMIESAWESLVAPQGLGELFQVLALTAQGAPVPAGFAPC